MATRGWESVTPDQVARATTPAAPRKYRNEKVVVDGIRFDSRAEAGVWLKLRDRENRREIYNLQRQVSFPLFTACRLEPAPTHLVQILVAEYVADFVFYEAGERHVVDVKRQATQTQVYQLKRKWLQLQDGIVIEEVSG